MTDETKKTGQDDAADATDDAPVIDASLVRKHDVFKDVTSKLQAERDEAKAKLREYEEKQKAAAKEAEERKLIETQNWEALKAAKDEEIAGIRSEYERKFLLKELETAIIAETPPTRDPYWLKGAIADYDMEQGVEGIPAWIASLKEASPGQFAAPTDAGRGQGLAPPPAVKGGGSTLTTDQLKAQLKDPSLARQAARELEARYMAGKPI